MLPILFYVMTNNKYDGKYYKVIFILYINLITNNKYNKFTLYNL